MLRSAALRHGFPRVFSTIMGSSSQLVAILFVKDNMGDFSFLESESFMALPPLQEIRKDSVVLRNLGTLLLDTPARYNKTEHHEYGNGK